MRRGRGSRAVRAAAPRTQGRAQEEECLQHQGPQVHAEVLQAADLLLSLQGLHLVSAERFSFRPRAFSADGNSRECFPYILW